MASGLSAVYTASLKGWTTSYLNLAVESVHADIMTSPFLPRPDTFCLLGLVVMGHISNPPPHTHTHTQSTGPLLVDPDGPPWKGGVRGHGTFSLDWLSWAKGRTDSQGEGKMHTSSVQ